jgi:capsule biosynthesis phosphatase
MKILIPLNGRGSRFAEKGYTDFKPFIKILGDTIIEKVVSSLHIDKQELVIIAREEFRKYNLENYFYKKFPYLTIKLVYLTRETAGAAETLYCGIKEIFNKDESFLAIDGDTIYNEDIISNLNDIDADAIFYTETQEQAAIYSYITLDNGRVLDIAEKNKISNFANTGAYYFKSSDTFCEIFEYVVKEAQLQQGEYYTSCVYKEMLNRGVLIKGIKITDIDVVGTPLQLQNYCLNHKSKPKKFVFDLDNTLVSYPIVKDDYTTVQPIKHNIEFLNNLKKEGHYIIIHTARRMKTHGGNVPKVVADIGSITLNTLKEFGISYDEISFGKPHGDFYIDDLAINPIKENLQRSTGFYYNEYIKARSFNSIKVQNNVITKTGNIKGEQFWYNNVPFYILNKYFPKILEITEDSISMEKIEGTTLSHLYTKDLFNKEILEKVVNSILEIHNFLPSQAGDFNKNYIPKIKDRYEKYSELYQKLPGASNVYADIDKFFKSYQAKKGCMIHGDPVFSNIFLTTGNNIKFIDVRGSSFNTTSLYGDPLYDLAKIFQSIVGYDFILLDAELNNKSIKEFTQLFADVVDNKNFNVQTIKKITKSLLFSLLPLHDDFQKIEKYFNLIHTF